MVRVLIIIAVTAFLLCAVSLSAAVAIGGRDMAKAGWSWGWGPGSTHFDHDRSGVHIRSHRGPQATRELVWDGSERLIVDIPAEVRFIQAEGEAKLTISGSQALVNAVRLENGRLRLVDDFNGHLHPATVTLTAPKVTQFELNGRDELVIEGYRQDRLQINVNGRSEVQATGEAKAIDLTVSGMGDADLANLAVDEATVSITGAGEATIAPKTRAKIDIAGTAEVTLLTRPTQLETNVTGAGKVIHADPDDEDAESPAPPPAPKPIA